MDIHNKTILITGATGGLGQWLVRLLCDAGATVIATGRNKDILQDLHTTTNCTILQADLLTDNGLKSIYDTIKTADIDMVINTSAVLDIQQIQNAADTQIDATIALNVTSVIKICRQAVVHMQGKNTPCKIVNIASVIQDFAIPYLGVYSASKYAIKGFTQSLQRELGTSHISTLLVAPRGIDTPMLNPMDRKFLALLPGKLDRPAYVASRIVQAIKSNKTQIKIGFMAKWGGYINHIFPSVIDTLFKTLHKKLIHIIKEYPK